jgi:uncharacterized protein
VPDIKAALDGARQILMERFSEDAALLAKLRTYLGEHALLASTVVAGKETEGAKFRDWFDFREAVATIPSHRALALLRGRNEDILRLALKTEPELRDPPEASPCVGMVAAHCGIRDQGRAADKLAAGNRALGLDGEALAAPRNRAHEPVARARRGRGDPRLRPQPARPAAGGTRRARTR